MKTLCSRVWMILTLKCDQASLLVSDSLDRKLVWYERAALKGHFFVCKVCPPLMDQLRLIHDAAKLQSKPESTIGGTEETVHSALSSDAKDRIKRMMRESNSSSS